MSVRPERFGALLYHFGTRRLSFVKTPVLLTVLEALPQTASARAACLQAGVTESDLPAYERALGALAASAMICERSAA